MFLFRYRFIRLLTFVIMASWLLLFWSRQLAIELALAAPFDTAQPATTPVRATLILTNTTSITPMMTLTATAQATIPPMPTVIWVTPTPPAADLFAAATLSIQMTVDATTTGTATPLPGNWTVATVRLLPYVPAPENTATAEALALEATARAVTTGEPAGIVFWTATPRPTVITATPSPTMLPLVVTATFTPEDVFAAATLAAQATLNATTTGTATPLPKGVALATNTPKPIVVTNTTTPENTATAAVMAARETAIAFTTGVPDPAHYVTATPPNLPATATPRPVNTATPIFIPLAELTATPAPGATPLFPITLVGRILFLADMDERNGPEAYAMDADGANIVRLTSLAFYQRAQEREAYSADLRYHTLVKKNGAGQRHIVYVDSFYGSEQSMTHFGAGNAWDPRWSPTADVVLIVANESDNDEIWLVRKGEWPAVQLTRNQWEWDKHPSWSPDGGQIVFMSNRSNSQQLWLMAADGSNQRQLTNFDFDVWGPVWVKYTDN